MNIFTALSDPTRFHIVEMLGKRGALPAGAIARQFAITAPAVSQHLRVLRNVQLVKVERRAQQRIYSLDTGGIDAMENWARTLKQLWEARLDALEEYLQQEVTMPQPVFTITRQVRAPRDRVWRAWTDPDAFRQWFGPKGCKIDTNRFELKPGGIVHSHLMLDGGGEMWGRFTYREIDAPNRLVWEQSFSDPECGLARHPFSPDWPLKWLTTVTFTEKKGGTAITLTWTPLDATETELATFAEGMDHMNQGWSGTFDQLEEFLGK